MSEILYGTEPAARIKAGIREKTEWLAGRRMPTLAIIAVDPDEGIRSYQSGISRTAAQLGMAIRAANYPGDIGEEALAEEVRRLSADRGTDGIIVQLPLPKGFRPQRIIDLIDPAKDVDGLTSVSIARFYNKEAGFVPCTAQAVIELLDYYQIPIAGRRAVVIGRSAAVGRPAAQLLLNRNATVTICHSRTPDLEREASQAEILVAAVGKAKLIKGAWIREGTAVIDVGVNVDESGKLCGDVDFPSLAGKDVKITPVPKGVGALTTAILMRNVLAAYEGGPWNTD